MYIDVNGDKGAMKKIFIFISIISSIAFAANVPKQEIFRAIQDSFRVALRDSIHWLEMEKNTDYTICTDDVNNGMWKGTDFSFKKENNCVLLNSGNYVKSGKLWYVTNMGNVHTFNLLVEMKYIDLSSKTHLLGFRGSDYKLKEQAVFWDVESEYHNREYLDSVRLVKIEEVLLVDKYMVTECEFIQALWDSIPANVENGQLAQKNFWIQKKKNMKKHSFCDSHDSAAIEVQPYLAFVYANIRSLRDGLNPVYSFSKAFDEMGEMKLYENGDFDIRKDFFGYSYNIHVSVDKFADGYRLPYYNEWMALARGGSVNYRYIWGDKKDSIVASQYAWFGIREPEDKYLKLKANDPMNRSFLKNSCGKWLQKSRPVGMLKPNSYGLYDMVGLVCENVMMYKKSIFNDEILSCKGGFLSDSLEALNLGSHCDTGNSKSRLRFQGLRLVRQIR